MAAKTYDFPDFDSLPSVEGQPPGCLWGFFDDGEKKDELGSQSPLLPTHFTREANNLEI